MLLPPSCKIDMKFVGQGKTTRPHAADYKKLNVEETGNINSKLQI